MKRVVYALLLTLFGIGTAAVAQQQAVVTITGKVYNKIDQHGIEKAHVVVKTTSGSIIGQRETDLEGIYTIEFRTEDTVWEAEATASRYNAIEVFVNKSQKEKNEVQIDFGLLPSEKTKEKVLPIIYFDFNSSYLTVEAKQQLQKVVAFLKANPTLKIKINGHTDSRGNKKYNDWLSVRRAQRVKEWLVKQPGVLKEQLKIGHFGKTQLQNKCATGVLCSSEQHLANRRCSFEIIK